MILTLLSTVDTVVEQIAHCSPFLSLPNIRHAGLLAAFFLDFWVPLALLVGCFRRFRGHEIILVQAIHVDANVLSHESNSQGMREPTDFERLATHRAENFWLGLDRNEGHGKPTILAYQCRE